METEEFVLTMYPNRVTLSTEQDNTLNVHIRYKNRSLVMLAGAGHLNTDKALLSGKVTVLAKKEKNATRLYPVLRRGARGHIEFVARLVLGIPSEDKKSHIRFKNGNTMDCRPDNLLKVSTLQAARPSRLDVGIYRTARGYRAVWWSLSHGKRKKKHHLKMPDGTTLWRRSKEYKEFGMQTAAQAHDAVQIYRTKHACHDVAAATPTTTEPSLEYLDRLAHAAAVYR